MNSVRIVLLIAAAMSTGLAAGTFLLYAHTVMPGLASTDDRTFTASYAALDRAIVNPIFMVSAFLGALVFTALAALVCRGTTPLLPAVIALALYAIAVVITVAVHLPLNDALKQAVAAGDHYDAAAVRQAFHASRWVSWNYVRTATSLGAFGCLCWALVLHGRATVPA